MAPLKRPGGALALLGGQSARGFLRRHWQRRPLLVRQAIPAFAGLVTAQELRRLAARADVQSRLVCREGRRWSLDHGPFPLRHWKSRATPPAWTLLVQELEFHVPAAQTLLQSFDFVPHARIDDVMVSHAGPGGGVGPHVDSYDVFLLQGPGRRRWRISGQADLAVRPGLPLRILRNFKAEQEWILEPGDMLYLPPGVAHEGTALEECFTYSIGFRAPAPAEWVGGFLMDFAERLQLPGRYGDPGLTLQKHPGALPRGMQDWLGRELSRLRFDRGQVLDFNGRFLTEPKPHVFFTAPDLPCDLPEFRRQAQVLGLALDPRSRMAFSGASLWCNGETFPLEPDQGACLVTLADRRRLAPEALAIAGRRPPAAVWRLLHEWYVDGWLKLGIP